MRRRLNPKPEQGTRISNSIVAHALPARDIVRVTEHDSAWNMLNDPERRLFRDWVNRMVDTHSFVWLDHPDRDRVAIFEAALKNANVPTGIVRHAVDAVVAEVVAEMPSSLKLTIKEVVVELIEEWVADGEADVQVARSKLMNVVLAALEKAGVV